MIGVRLSPELLKRFHIAILKNDITIQHTVESFVNLFVKSNRTDSENEVISNILEQAENLKNARK
jgi:hypothetical protein